MTSAANLQIEASSIWAKRLTRARELSEGGTTAHAVLRFYAAVLEFQAEVSRSVIGIFHSDRPFKEQVDIQQAASNAKKVLDLAIMAGPDLLASRAGELKSRTEDEWSTSFHSYLSSPPKASADQDDFFLRACLQPVAEHLQLQACSTEVEANGMCPVCSGAPQLIILLPEGDGAARWLQCSFCLKEWLFRRVVCPWCGEQDKEKLPRFSSQEPSHVHISACDTCRKYLKAVDLTVQGRAVPLVDEVDAAVLDVWAVEHGYDKIIPNLMAL